MREPILDSTRIFSPLLLVCSVTREEITAPTWSPGDALSGTTTSNGTITSLPGFTVTSSADIVTQVPTSVGFSAEGKSANWPLVVENASVA